MANSRNNPGRPAADPRGGHVRLYWEILDSNAWRCLSATEQRAYVALQRQSRSTNNGDLSLPLSVVRLAGITSPATLAKSLRALVAVGLLAVTRKGGCTKGGQRLPSLYRFTDRETYENPMKHIESAKATNEWKLITTLGLGREAIRKAEATAAAKVKDDKTKTEKNRLQRLMATASKNEVVGALTASNIEAWSSFHTTNIEAGEKPKTSHKANSDRGLRKSAEIANSENHTTNIEVLSITAIHRAALGMPTPRIPASEFCIDELVGYRRLTAKPVELFTNLIH